MFDSVFGHAESQPFVATPAKRSRRPGEEFNEGVLSRVAAAPSVRERVLAVAREAPQLALVCLCVIFVFLAVAQSCFAVKYERSVSFSYEDGGADVSGTWASGVSRHSLWLCVAHAWHHGSRALSFFLGAWGLFAFVKLGVVSCALVYYRRSPMPSRYEYFNTFAHYSFLDVYWVLLICLMLDETYTGSAVGSVGGADDDGALRTVSYRVLASGAALNGCYAWFFAVAFSQLACFCCIKYAQSRETRELWSRRGLRELCARCLAQPPLAYAPLGWRVLGLERGVWDTARPRRERRRRVLAFWGGAVLAVVLFALIIFALHAPSFAVRSEQHASVNADDIVFGVSLDDTKRYSLVGGLLSALAFREDARALAWIAYVFVLVLPACRAALLALVWAVPLPDFCHHALLFAVQLSSNLVQHDVYFVAFVLSVWAGHMQELLKNYVHDDDPLGPPHITTWALPGAYCLLFTFLADAFWCLYVVNSGLTEVAKYDYNQPGFLASLDEEVAKHDGDLYAGVYNNILHSHTDDDDPLDPDNDGPLDPGPAV